MDGLEWKRSKYGPVTRKFLVRAEKWAAKHADILVADSVGIRDYIREKYARDAIYIPYGAEVPEDFNPQTPGRWDLRIGDYHLLMARMEPENNVEMIIRGWLASGKDKPLVLIGNCNNGFGQYLTGAYRHEKLRFLGAIYDQPTVNALRHFSSLYLHGHSVGGTNPSLLEAMACGCTIAAHDNPFNKAILQEEAFYFSTSEDVCALLDARPAAALTGSYRQRNLDKLIRFYNWRQIIGDYERLFLQK